MAASFPPYRPSQVAAGRTDLSSARDVARSGRRRREIEERVSDPGEGRSPIARAAIGCGVGCFALVLLAGAIGIGVGAQRRMAGWGGEDEVEDPSLADPTVSEPDPGVDPITPTPPVPQDDMRRRYRPGPHARLESMVPSGRLVLPTVVPGQVVAGRTVDNPWLVPGADLVPAPMPAASPGGPRVWHEPAIAAGPLAVIVRTPARAEVAARDASGGTAVMTYLVDFAGYQGHFVLPATAPTELGAVSASGSEGATVHFAILAPLRPGGAPVNAGESFPVTMRIAAVDAQGRVSSPITRELSVMAVGAGDVEVTLTMSEPTDLDLYVTEPSGQTIFFGNTQAMSGGHLDLDANAACSSNLGVNNEHVYWPAGRAQAGTYRVNVGYWESCIGGRPVTYRLTLRACGETVVLTGSFAGSSNSERCFAANPADPSWCQEVVTFDVPPCPP